MLQKNLISFNWIIIWNEKKWSVGIAAVTQQYARSKKSRFKFLPNCTAFKNWGIMTGSRFSPTYTQKFISSITNCLNKNATCSKGVLKRNSLLFYLYVDWMIVFSVHIGFFVQYRTLDSNVSAINWSNDAWKACYFSILTFQLYFKSDITWHFKLFLMGLRYLSCREIECDLPIWVIKKGILQQWIGTQTPDCIEEHFQQQFEKFQWRRTAMQSIPYPVEVNSAVLLSFVVVKYRQ